MAGETEVFKIEIDGLDQLDQLKKAWADIKKNRKIKMDLEGGSSTAAKGAGAFGAFVQKQKQMMGEEFKNLTTMRKSLATHFVGGIQRFGDVLKRWSMWAVGAISGFAFWGLRMAKEVRQQVLAGRFMGESAVTVRAANYAMKQSGIGMGESAGEDVLTKISRAKLLPQEAQYMVMSGVTGWEQKAPAQIFQEMIKNIAGMDKGMKGTIGEMVASHFGLDVQRITPESVADYQRNFQNAPKASEAELNRLSDLNLWWERFKEQMEVNGIRIMAKFGPVLRAVVDALDKAATKLTSYLLSDDFSNDMKAVGTMFKSFAVKLSGLLEALGVKTFVPRGWKEEIEAEEKYQKRMDKAMDVSERLQGMVQSAGADSKYRNPASVASYINSLGSDVDKERVMQNMNTYYREHAAPGYERQAAGTLYIRTDGGISVRVTQANSPTGNTPMVVGGGR